MSTRRALRLVGVSVFVVMIAASVWVIVTPARGRTADCQTAQAMWTYYESQMATERAAAQEANVDNAATEAAYRTTGTELQAYANRITTPEIRAKADFIVAINHDMFEQWKSWAAASQSEPSAPAALTPSDRQFGREFARNAQKLETTHQDLERACR